MLPLVPQNNKKCIILKSKARKKFGQLQMELDTTKVQLQLSKVHIDSLERELKWMSENLHKQTQQCAYLSTNFDCERILNINLRQQKEHELCKFKNQQVKLWQVVDDLKSLVEKCDSLQAVELELLRIIREMKEVIIPTEDSLIRPRLVNKTKSKDETSEQNSENEWKETTEMPENTSKVLQETPELFEKTKSFINKNKSTLNEYLDLLSSQNNN